jgi:hypothetical protein
MTRAWWDLELVGGPFFGVGGAGGPTYIPFWLIRAQRSMIPPQYVSLELRAWVFGCPFLRGVRRDGVLIWADKRERKVKSPALPNDGRVGYPKFKIKAWATRPKKRAPENGGRP